MSVCKPSLFRVFVLRLRKAEVFRRSAANTQLKVAQCEYAEIRAELSEAQYRLQSHRAEHGC